MIKRLTNIGNSMGLIIEKPILELLRIDGDTPLEVSTDGEALIIRPMREGAAEADLKAAATRAMDAHDAAFRKLAK